jgi:hypothetical protein
MSKAKVGTITLCKSRSRANGGLAVYLRTYDGSRTKILAGPFSSRHEAEKIRTQWISISRSLCRYVKHYHSKNGYSPTKEVLPNYDTAFDLAQKLALVDLVPIFEGEQPLGVILTDAGLREANEL